MERMKHNINWGDRWAWDLSKYTTIWFTSAKCHEFDGFNQEEVSASTAQSYKPQVCTPSFLKKVYGRDSLGNWNWSCNQLANYF
jgi:hypothetical protein